MRKDGNPSFDGHPERSARRSAMDRATVCRVVSRHPRARDVCYTDDMPMSGITVTLSVLESALILIALLVVGFLLRQTQPREVEVNLPAIPTKKDLDEAARSLEKWMEAANEVSGWKAATYGAVGTVVGAIGGLGANFVLEGEITLTEIGRLVIATVVLLAITGLAIVAIEWGKIVEKVAARLRRSDETSQSSPPSADPPH